MLRILHICWLSENYYKRNFNMNFQMKLALSPFTFDADYGKWQIYQMKKMVTKWDKQNPKKEKEKSGSNLARGIKFELWELDSVEYLVVKLLLL